MADGTVELGGSDANTATQEEVRELETALRPEGSAAPADGAVTVDEQGNVIENADDDGDERTTRVDTELNEARDDAEREAIRARRRAERQRKKQFRTERVDTLERLVAAQSAQIEQQTAILAQLQNTDAGAKLAQLDSAITEAAEVYDRYKGILADATAKADGTTAAEATERMMAARERHTHLTGVKQQIVQHTRAPQPVDTRVATAAQQFAAKHPWYKGVQSQDPDSQVLTVLDNGVARDKFDPTTAEYWAELESRARRYLPHRFVGKAPAGGREAGPAAGEDETGYDSGDAPAGGARPRSPVGGAGGAGNRSVNAGNSGGFRLSAERVSAMKEAGIWSDPVRRKKMIAEYKALDSRETSR